MESLDVTSIAESVRQAQKARMVQQAQQLSAFDIAKKSYIARQKEKKEDLVWDL